ncbi:MAG: TonB-dependent receptor [Alteriqipengyuania sp.]|uniref:TonB-dependent receptor domain-containing protein n=1 Tax=Alteriqipengyuania sp. TaxID=2800692 RepID=UPI0026992407|tara:strand:+ start:55221 stop:58283 length:3063 start_codon:yes stop_codon:yes gene_type:complete
MNTLLRTLLVGSSLTVMAGLAAPALAQEVPDASASQDEDVQEEAAPTNEIVVTGSRVRRETYNTNAPVDVVTREETVLAGTASVADALQDSTLASGSAQLNEAYLGFVSPGGAAANSIGLRGLGPQRTLVLLNGRRLSPAGVGPELIAADLNVLPNAILQRIEVLREGASSIYGSDAIAGVVNLITDEVDGVTVDFYTNQPVEHGGGGRTYRASVTGGTVFDGGYITGSFEYREQTPLKVRDREEFRCPTDLLTDPDTGEPVGQRVPGSDELRCFPFDSGGIAQNYLLVADTGINRYSYRDGDITQPYLVNDLDIRPLASRRQLDVDVTSALRTFTGFLSAGVDVGALGNAEIYGEALVTRRESQQNDIAQINYNADTIGFEVGPRAAATSITGLPVVAYPFAPTALDTGGTQILRPFIVPPIVDRSQEVNYYRGVAGIRGDLGFGNFRYDASVVYSLTDSTSTVEGIDARKFRNAVTAVIAPDGTPDQFVTVAGPGTVGAGNRYTCAANVAGGNYLPGANCVLFNFADPAVLAGDIPQASLNYLYEDVVGETSFEQITGQLILDGTLLDLPAGPVNIALGAEFRRDSIDDNPSEIAQSGNLYNFTSSGRTKGSDEVIEAFGEASIPILADKPFFRELTLDVSARITDYESYGSDFTYRVGGTWAPTDFLRFRGSYGTAYRAPNLYEQFVADQTGFYPASFDPCDEFASVFDPSSNRYQNCLADLEPILGTAGALNFTATGGPQVITQGGRDVLEAETSTSWGLGAILTLPAVGFSLTADYFNIEVNGQVDLLNSGILSRCFNSDDFRSGNEFCEFIEARDDGQGNLTSFRNPYLNIASQKVEGIDFSARQSMALLGGQFTADLRATRMLTQELQSFEGDEPVNYNGRLAFQSSLGGPKWVGDADLRFSFGDITFRYGLQYVGPMDGNEFVEEGLLAAPVVDGDPVDFDLLAEEYFEHDISVQFRIQDLGQLTLGVNNVFNNKPSVISSAGGFPRIGNYFNYSGYDIIGRSFFLNMTRSF